MQNKGPLGLLLIAAALLLHEAISYYFGKIMEWLDPKGDQLMAHIPDWQTMIGIACALAAALIWWGGGRWTSARPSRQHLTFQFIAPHVGPAPALKDVYSRTYRGETVEIDNHHFHDCTFERANFFWKGGSYIFTNVTITPPSNFRCKGPLARNTLSFLRFLELLEPSYSQKLREFPPDEPK